MHPNLKVLFIGDIIGRPGRRLIYNNFNLLKEKYNPDFIIANIENIAGGMGITKKIMDELEDKVEIDVYTTGNHVWDKKEFEKYVNYYEKVLIPANYPENVPGNRYYIAKKEEKKLGVFNLLGRALMNPTLDCPFRTAKEIIEILKKETVNIFLDFHAEATSEKNALAFYLNGEISALIGTHTHIQTSDDRILDNGTAYITDAGMTGVFDSVIGYDEKIAIKKFLTQMPKKHEVKTKGQLVVQGVYIELDENGKALKIERIKIFY